MRNPQQLFLLHFLLLPLIHTTHAKFIIEPCSSSDSCTSLLSYLLPWDSKLSEIAFRFQVNITDLMAANNLTASYPGNQIFALKTRLKIPIQCHCVDGIRRSVSRTYTVQPADSLESISEKFGGLVSVDQIRMVKDMNGNKKNQLRSGESILIPLPCTCFGNSDNGVSTVFMSYVVQREESLSRIGMEFGTTVNELVTVNGLGQPVVDPGDILAIPISACSSANLNWYNESLIVPNGSYALTANNCIKCICGPTHLNLQCVASGLDISCSHLQCKGSNLFIGDFYTNQTAPGYCNVIKCIYRGHSGRKIFRSIVNTSAHVQGSGMKDCSSLPPATLPPYSVPFAALPPSSCSSSSLSPYPASSPIAHDHIGATSPLSSKPPITSSSSLSYGDYNNLFFSEIFFLYYLFAMKY